MPSSRLAISLGALALAGLVVFAVFAAIHDRFPGDIGVSEWTQSWRPAWFVTLMKVVSYFGDPKVAVPLVAVVTAALYLRRLRLEALVVAGAAIAGYALRGVLKELVARPRPSEDVVEILDLARGFSFPSGHVMHHVVLLGTLGALSYSGMRPGLRRQLLVAGFLAAVAAMGFSRIFLGVHWLSDVVGGYAIGIAVVTVAVWSWRRRRIPVDGDERTTR